MTERTMAERPDDTLAGIRQYLGGFDFPGLSDGVGTDRTPANRPTNLFPALGGAGASLSPTVLLVLAGAAAWWLLRRKG